MVATASRVLTLHGVLKGHKDVSPTNPNRFVFSGYLPVDEVPKLAMSDSMPWCNPRYGYSDQKGVQRSSYVAREIKGSLNEPGFHERNQGIDLVANNATLENGILTIDFGTIKSLKRGLGNGGTTTMVIIDALVDGVFVQPEEKDKKQYVKLSVYCGEYENADVDDMVEAWNTNRQVDTSSLANFTGKYEWIKKQLEKSLPGPGKFPKVAYFFGDTGDYRVEEVIQILSLFAMPDAAKAYSGFGGCLDFFLTDLEQGKESKLRELEPVLLDLLYLSEIIPGEIQEMYNAKGKKGKGGVFKGLGMIEKGNAPSALPYARTEITFTPHKAWLLPLVASFRGALDFENGPVHWKVNPIQLFREIGVSLFNTIQETFEEQGSNFNKTGRDKNLYKGLIGDVADATRRNLRKGAASGN